MRGHPEASAIIGTVLATGVSTAAYISNQIKSDVTAAEIRGETARKELKDDMVKAIGNTDAARKELKDDLVKAFDSLALRFEGRAKSQ